MAESISPPKINICIDASFAETIILSDESKNELQDLCSGMQWVEEEDVLEKFRCRKCERITVSYSVTNCDHLFCETCFGLILQRPCPVAHCCNDIILQAKQNVQLDVELCQLKAKCIWRNFGCTEVLPLRNFLDHRANCPVFTEKLCPTKGKFLDKNNAAYDKFGDENFDVLVALKQLEINMKRYYHDMRDNDKVELMRYLDDEIAKKLSRQKMDLSRTLYSNVTEDLLCWHRDTEKKLTDKMTTVVNESMMDLEMRTERHLQTNRSVYKKEFENFATDVMKVKGENLKTGLVDELRSEIRVQTEKNKQELRNHFNSILQTNLHRHKDELTKRIETEFNKTFSGDFYKSMESQISTKVEIQSSKLFSSLSHQLKDDSERMETDLLMKLTQHLTRKLDGDLDTWSNRITTKLNEELEMKIELQRTYLEEAMNGACQKEFLNRKTESEEIKRMLFQPYKNPSFRAQWVEWALKERRTEFVWKVLGVISLLQQWRKECKGHLVSEVFVTKEFGFKIRAKLEYRNEKWIRLSIGFVNEEEEAPLTRPSIYFHRRTAILVDQSEGSGPKRDIVRIMEPIFGNEDSQRLMNEFWVWYEFVSMRCLEGGAPYVVKDALCLRILIEPLSVLWKSFASTNGMLLWRIDDYSKKKKASLEGVIDYLYSDSFYSNSTGYRMQLQFDVRPTDALGMCVLFLRGEWDDFLPQEFPHKITLTIFDQSNFKRKKHWIRTEKSEFTSNDWLEWIPKSEIERAPYLKDDCLLIKVIVEPDR